MNRYDLALKKQRKNLSVNARLKRMGIDLSSYKVLCHIDKEPPVPLVIKLLDHDRIPQENGLTQEEAKEEIAQLKSLGVTLEMCIGWLKQKNKKADMKKWSGYLGALFLEEYEKDSLLTSLWQTEPDISYTFRGPVTQRPWGGNNSVRP